MTFENRIKSVKIRELIEIVHIVGLGTEEDPILRVVSIYDKDGTLIVEGEDICERW